MQRQFQFDCQLLKDNCMKNISASLRTIFILLTIILLLPGCVKDKITRTYKIFSPIYKTSAEVRANIKSNVSQNIINPGKIFIRGKYIFLNEIDKGIHIIDNSNPASPKNVAFIDIPGNLDLAVKGNTLYADFYSDLVTLDITDPLHVTLNNVVANAFPERIYSNGFIADNSKIIVDWISKDTTVNEGLEGNISVWRCSNCMFDSQFMSLSSSTVPGSKASSPFGMGGSMARFSIVNNTLYTVSNASLNVYSITTPENPVSVNKISMGWGIETIYPFKNKLFIGSNSGMFIYDVTNESNPVKIGKFSHLTACDPVIADEKYAFVTLRGGVRCSNGSNQLDVLDISLLTAPLLVKSYPMTGPLGLSKDGNTLFICDGTDGLKVYDASDVKDLKLINHIKGFETYDVIAYNNVVIVVCKDGLRQYDYTSANNVSLLSKLGWAE